MSGFVLAHRDIMSHPLFEGHPERLGAWFWLIMKAAWKPTPFDLGGKIVTIERGQLSVSIRYLADAWGWSKSSTERFLSRLKTETMIETASGTGRLLITICNYSKFQDQTAEAGTASGTASGTAAGQQRDIKEQVNKGTRDILDKSNISHSVREGESEKPKTVKKFAMTAHWKPSDLPPKVADLTALWPPGRLEREIDQFRDYWQDRTDKRPGWDRSLHNRIRDIHERVLRESQYGNGNYNGGTQPRINPVAQAVIDRRTERAG